FARRGDDSLCARSAPPRILWIFARDREPDRLDDQGEAYSVALRLDFRQQFALTLGDVLVEVWAVEPQQLRHSRTRAQGLERVPVRAHRRWPRKGRRGVRLFLDGENDPGLTRDDPGGDRLQSVLCIQEHSRRMRREGGDELRLRAHDLFHRNSGGIGVQQPGEIRQVVDSADLEEPLLARDLLYSAILARVDMTRALCGDMHLVTHARRARPRS